MAVDQPKTNLTNNLYQSQFLPILQRAETKIKDLIMVGALTLQPLFLIRIQIQKTIQQVNELLPNDLIDRETYIKGLTDSSERMISRFYKSIVFMYSVFSVVLINKGIVKDTKKVDNPISLFNYVGKLKDNEIKIVNEEVKNEINLRQPYKKDLWAEQKAYPRVENYQKRIKEQLNGASKFDFAPQQEGKKRISVWQKAELDIRHDKQIEMIQELKDEGVELCWISSHPDCSKRCEKWQGVLVDINKPSEMSGFRLKGKVDGNTVYSLTDITNQVDKYGYKNNIIVGFNCRHHLTPYKEGSVAPKEYNADEIKKEREINSKLRQYERAIRELKMKAKLYATIDKRVSIEYTKRAKILTEQYKNFANDNGFAWYQYRITI